MLWCSLKYLSALQPQLMSSNPQEITLVWDSPQGDLDSFEVQYLDAQGRLIQNFTYTNSISIGGLRPYRKTGFILTFRGSMETFRGCSLW